MIEGISQISEALKDFGKSADKAIDNTVFAVAHLIRGDAIKSINTVTEGNTSRRSRQGGGTYLHTAGKKGEAPNTDTGDLVASIAVEHERGSGEAFVGTNLDYGRILEEIGWPWLYPAQEMNRANFRKILVKNLEEEIRKA